jgi:hypothetical protein
MFAFAPVALSAATLSNGFGYRRAITVAGSAVPSTQLNFPMLVSGTFPYLATLANGGLITKLTTLNSVVVPADLIFTSDPSGSALLKWEIASYTLATGAIEVWVQIPSLSNGTVVYMFYNNPSATTYAGNAAGAWDPNFGSVYHMGQNPNGSAPQLTDSTVNGVNLTTSVFGTGTLSSVPGQIGSAVYTTSANEYNGASLVSTANSGGGAGSWSISGWFNFRGFDSYDSGFNPILGVSTGSSHRLIVIDNSNVVTGQVFGSGNSSFIVTAPTSPLSTGAWYFFCVTFDGTTVALYQNGALVGTAAGVLGTVSDGVVRVAYSAAFQARATNSYFDEIRFSSTNRSAGWIATEYNNQSSPSTFYTIGSSTSMIAAGTAMTTVII